MKELLHGYYATRIYLPFSGLARKWQRFIKRLMKKESTMLQQIRLPEVSWKKFTDRRRIKVWETDQESGNVRISELAVINAIAAEVEDETNLFEIGTFNGRTTLNLALSSPPGCKIHTLDLLPTMETRFDLAPGERHLVEKKRPGQRMEKYRAAASSVIDKIRQLVGDSATFDFSPYRHACSLVFVDGSHSYEYVMSDTYAAMNMVADRGVIIWHDYGIWKDVTRALEEIESREKLGLKNIKGTSLVYWKNGATRGVLSKPPDRP